MAQVYISYGPNDETQALAVADFLESHEISCWLKCRNMSTSENFSDEILCAIQECQVFLLLLTHSAVTSMDIINELTLASRNKKQNNRLILPLKLEDISLPDAFEYHLATAPIHPFILSEDICRFDLIGTVRNHLASGTELKPARPRWADVVEKIHSLALEEMEYESPEEQVYFQGLFDAMKNATPREFLELYSTIMDDDPMDCGIDADEMEAEMIQLLQSNPGLTPEEAVFCLPCISRHLENLNDEEAEGFRAGLLTALEDIEMNAQRSSNAVE